MSIIESFIVPHPPLIVHEVGKGEERQIQKTLDAYKHIAKEISVLKPETIVITTPHSIMYSDYIHISPGAQAKGDFWDFGVSNFSMKKNYDTQFVSELEKEASKQKINAGTKGQRDKNIDHGVLVPLYFVDKYFTDYNIVRISISGLSFLEHYQFGKCISKVSNLLNRKVVFIASGDLSHKLKQDSSYGFTQEGPEFDKRVTQVMKDTNFLKFMEFDEEFCDKAGECGLRSFIIMAGALDGKSVKSDFYSYESPFGVGYAICKFEINGDDKRRYFDEKYKKIQKDRLVEIKNNEDDYVRLARMSLENYIVNHSILKRPSFLCDDMIKNRAGVFVSIKKRGKLRGCIGTISGVFDCIADEIINNAISSGTKDVRFPPIVQEELDELVYSVDILGSPENIDSLDNLDAKKYGVIVTRDNRRGLLLPNLDGVDTPKQQIQIALQKAGIKNDETFDIERFEVVRHR